MESKNKITGFLLDKKVLEMYRELTVENKKKLGDYLQYLQWTEIEKANLRIEEIMEYEMKEIEENLKKHPEITKLKASPEIKKRIDTIIREDYAKKQ